MDKEDIIIWGLEGCSWHYYGKQRQESGKYDRKQGSICIPAFPDPYSFILELGSEIGMQVMRFRRGAGRDHC